MDLSIIIVSYNTKELLADCLKSVKIATATIKTEVFVIDNASSDGSAELVSKNYNFVKLVENKQNLGFSKANNIALKKIRSKYVLILNPDTKLMPDTLTKMINFMDSHQKVGVATCRVELANGKLDRDCRRRFPT